MQADTSREEEVRQCVQDARAGYWKCINDQNAEWWTDVIVTVSSTCQAGIVKNEIQRRRKQERLPRNAKWWVVPDPDGVRIGSGGATLNALRELAGSERQIDWGMKRILLIHSGGESRRLPQYSGKGKLFSVLPVITSFGETSSVFDELLALSTSWVRYVKCGLLVSSGDVILAFDSSKVKWSSRGVSAVGILKPVELSTGHGMYIVDEKGRVKSFLQKPSVAQAYAAGGVRSDGRVALDSGLLYFAGDISSRLGRIATAHTVATAIDLYEHFTMALTQEWRPAAGTSDVLIALGQSLQDALFHCSVVEGQFIHVGTTQEFRKIFTDGLEIDRLYKDCQRLKPSSQPGLACAGVTVDSRFTGGGELSSGAVGIECDLNVPIRIRPGAIIHGLRGLRSKIDVPEDVVVHQLYVLLPGWDLRIVIRVYGASDNPKRAEWFGQPIEDVLRHLGIRGEAVWAGVPQIDRCLWNARLFVAGCSIEESWGCARWLMQIENSYSVDRWLKSVRVSFADSARIVDETAIAETRSRFGPDQWQRAAEAVVSSGADIAPLLTTAPTRATLIRTGLTVIEHACRLRNERPTEAASRYHIAARLLGQARLDQESDQARNASFSCVHEAVTLGVSARDLESTAPTWRYHFVRVSAPARIDLGGGWSDTPPFCLDWGGAVMNIAVELNGTCPIQAHVRRIQDPVIRCIAGDDHLEFVTHEELTRNLAPRSPFLISQVSLQLLTCLNERGTLRDALAKRGGGLEIVTRVNLPIGSGLGTSSILAAAILRALSAMLGSSPSPSELSDLVMLVEQRMRTGGGWQDQVGAIYPGAKLATSGPGMCQKISVQQLNPGPEMHELLLVYYTGIQRLAKGLLQQVVGRYLMRDAAAVEALHSIKGLAIEMADAVRRANWAKLGFLMDRHWQLNQILDPKTTTPLINKILGEVKPYVSGAKLAGAGGGGFLLLLAKSPEDAVRLRHGSVEWNRGLYDWRIRTEGLAVECHE